MTGTPIFAAMDDTDLRSNEHLAQTSPNPLGLEIERADGCYLYDTSGKIYLDLIAGLAVNNIGHNNPHVLNALEEQARKHLHVMPYGEFRQQAQIDFAQAICAELPTELGCIYFVNSGTEAVEGALKLAKRITGRTQLIGFDKSYHGSTHGSLSVTGNETKRFRNRPLLPDAFCIPFNSSEALELITTRTAAVIVEPIQGDAGVRIPDSDWMQALKERTMETGSILIFDEVQTGFGRTGKLFAFEHFSVVPDILVLGKALGGGMPLGAFVSSHKNMRKLSERPILGHITTFGGHPIPCSTGLAALEYILEHKLWNKANKIGELFRQYLNHEAVIEIRGKGAMLAIQLESKNAVQQVVLGAMEHGVLGFWFLSCPDAFRIAPPLTLSNDQIEFACDVLNTEFDKLQ